METLSIESPELLATEALSGHRSSSVRDGGERLTARPPPDALDPVMLLPQEE